LREALLVNTSENILIESAHPADGLENPMSPKFLAVPVQAEIANHYPQPGWEFRTSPKFEGTQAAKPLLPEPLAHEEKTVGHGISVPLEKLYCLEYVGREGFQKI
jgi:hypothetical protein